MIVSFQDAVAEALFHGEPHRRLKRLPPEILSRASDKLDLLNAARDLRDLTSPPSNRLEKLRGNLAGFYSIRINQQWRIVFRWQDADVHDVAIVDYHG